MKRSLITLFLLVAGVVGVGTIAASVEAHTRTVKVKVDKNGFSPSSIDIVCSSTTPATGLLADTSAAPSLAVIAMKAPVAFCPATVPRTQGPSTLTSAASAQPAHVMKPATTIERLSLIMKDSSTQSIDKLRTARISARRQAIQQRAACRFVDPPAPDTRCRRLSGSAGDNRAATIGRIAQLHGCRQDARRKTSRVNLVAAGALPRPLFLCAMRCRIMSPR